MLGQSATIVDVIRRYRNFAPFVRQTGEKKAQTCAIGMLRQSSNHGLFASLWWFEVGLIGHAFVEVEVS